MVRKLEFGLCPRSNQQGSTASDARMRILPSPLLAHLPNPALVQWRVSRAVSKHGAESCEEALGEGRQAESNA
jgi:hypothetical protein